MVGITANHFACNVRMQTTRRCMCMCMGMVHWLVCIFFRVSCTCIPHRLLLARIGASVSYLLCTVFLISNSREPQQKEHGC